MGQSHFRSFRWLTVKIVIPIKQEFYQQKYPILQGFQPLSAKNKPQRTNPSRLIQEKLANQFQRKPILPQQRKLLPLIKPQKAKSLAISRLLAFSISIVPHNVPQILGVFEVPKNQQKPSKTFFLCQSLFLNLCSWCRGVAAVCGGSANYDFKIRTEEAKS